jgi:hypothetical protein
MVGAHGELGGVSLMEAGLASGDGLHGVSRGDGEGTCWYGVVYLGGWLDVQLGR